MVLRLPDQSEVERRPGRHDPDRGRTHHRGNPAVAPLGLSPEGRKRPLRLSPQGSFGFNLLPVRYHIHDLTLSNERLPDSRGTVASSPPPRCQGRSGSSGLSARSGSVANSFLSCLTATSILFRDFDFSSRSISSALAPRKLWTQRSS